MASVVLAARLVLAAVFAVAGVAKLLDLHGARTTLDEFGVRKRLIPVVAVLLPLTELATAAALVPTPSASWGALAGVLLMLGFSAGIVNALSRGRAPECHCFGQLHSSPAGKETLARNAALATLAAVVLWQGPGPAIDSWVAARTGAELAAVALGAATLLLAAIALRLRREKGRLERDLDATRAELAAFPPGLPVGAVAPDFELPSVHGDVVSLNRLRAAGRPVALVFVDPGCGPCGPLFSEVGRWQATVADALTLAVISSGSRGDNLAAARDGLAPILLQKESEVMLAYRLRATPSAVVVAPEGRIASATASGSVAIEALVRLTLRRQAAESPAPAPSPQPTA